MNNKHILDENKSIISDCKSMSCAINQLKLQAIFECVNYSSESSLKWANIMLKSLMKSDHK